ncbi:amidohydrolase 2 [Salinisphaera dokdonensis CL-ES53]|uniref:Amidohydrolase 2 n=1 Tax=Salinisphaera dokdonensis CL-ES53 TaxID=1304272 RepID=A0ABV2AZ70_9GAMM
MDDSVNKNEARRAKPLDVQEITTRTDTRDILANARRDVERYNLDDYFIADIDAHHVELDNWDEILECIEDPVLRYNGKAMSKNWPNAGNVALSNHPPGLTQQDVAGRIPHQAELAEDVPDSEEPRDITLVRRVMDSLGLDVQIVFPQPMLEIGLHPSKPTQTQLIKAYNKWFVERVLHYEPRIKTMLALPFSDAEACMQTIEQYADHPQVIGFLVTSQRDEAVFEPQYVQIYAELERRGLPIGFHAGPDYNVAQAMNRFISVHALSFVTCNMIHLTNWVMNAMPERFPNLDVIWIESGLAWMPFMMQRLDHEYLMRQSDAPQLTKLPSEYMREMYYTSQPLEVTDMKLLESTFTAINAETQLLYSSDWPHWDFDTPARIANLPFLSEKAKRNILGENAKRLFSKL